MLSLLQCEVRSCRGLFFGVRVAVMLFLVGFCVQTWSWLARRSVICALVCHSSVPGQQSGQAQISTRVFDSLESYAECVRRVAARSLY